MNASKPEPEHEPGPLASGPESRRRRLELEIIHELWGAALGVELHMDPADYAASQWDTGPAPVYVSIPRSAYLPSHSGVRTIVGRFRQYAACHGREEPWFSVASTSTTTPTSVDVGIGLGECVREHEHEGETEKQALLLPLRVHLPLGVLCDSLQLLPQPPHAQEPLRITVHFQDRPASLLHVPVAPFPNTSTTIAATAATTANSMRSLYSHAVKQALYLLRGSARAYTELHPQQQQALFAAAQMGDGDSFASILELLLEGVGVGLRITEPRHGHGLGAAAPVGPAGQRPRYPIRILRGGVTLQRPHDVYAYLPSPSGDGGGPSEQRKLEQEQKQEQSLLQLLAPLYPANTPTAAIESNVLMQGIRPSLHMSVGQAWRLFRSTDLYLYISVKSVLPQPH